jgi:hypothetical protein
VQQSEVVGVLELLGVEASELRELKTDALRQNVDLGAAGSSPPGRERKERPESGRTSVEIAPDVSV